MACLQQTVPTASVPTASAAAGAVQVNATRSTTSMRPANTSEYERDSMDCQNADTPVHSGQRDPRTPMKGQAGNPAGDEDGWQTVLTLRQKKALAQGKKLKANVVENEGNASQPQLSQATPTARRKPFSWKLPPLPKEDFKVVIRPHQGLPLKNFTSPQLAEAVITACRGQVSGDKFLLRLKPGSNIFIVSTPDQATADHIRRITELRVHGRTHAVNAYVATGEGHPARTLGKTQPSSHHHDKDGSAQTAQEDSGDEDEEWPSLHPEKVKKKPEGSVTIEVTYEGQRSPRRHHAPNPGQDPGEEMQTS
ncbi:hypothetical protein MTO96_046111, partial [Rhipicephalus appendiculatus]